ncbi:MAG: T9SS type A sorting domain-containing protein [Aureispira sp.]
MFFLHREIHAQNVFYYGPDTTYHYYPSDIIATQNGELILMADINNRGSWFHNPFFKRYIARIETNGNKVWDLTHADTRGTGHILEQANGGLITLNNVDGAYMCGLIGQSVPYTDYSINSYTSTGALSTTNNYDEACDNSLTNFQKRDDGGLMAVQVADNFSSYQYSIKEVDPTGQLSSLAFPASITGGALIEKNASGYWILQYNDLYRVDLAGNIVRQDTIVSYPYLNSFIKVQQDSLLVASSAEHVSAPDLTYLSKYDSVGNKDWTQVFSMETNHVLWHSSGNYLLTGTRNNQLSLLLVSPAGDSLWSTTQGLIQSSSAVKTIEIGQQKIATLGRENSAFTLMRGRAIVIIDSIDLSPVLNTVKKVNPLLAVDVFPNPSSDQVHFNIKGTETQTYRVELFSMLGQLMLSKSFEQNSFSMEVGLLPKGMYVVRIIDDKGTSYEQTIIVGH